MRAQEIRAALDRHWTASDANDFETEHDIYLEDAVLEYPQSGERIRGRRNIQITRTNQPSKKRFAVRRIIGSGDLWITEYILTDVEKPHRRLGLFQLFGAACSRLPTTSTSTRRSGCRQAISFGVRFSPGHSSGLVTGSEPSAPCAVIFSGGIPAVSTK